MCVFELKILKELDWAHHVMWNGLPLAQQLLPRVHSDTFYSSLKTALFSRAIVGSAYE